MVGSPRPLADASGSASFRELLNWHLLRGTRLQGAGGRTGRSWNTKEFAAALGVSDRTIRYWLKDQHLPTDIESIERVLFGENPTAGDEWRLALRLAHQATASGAPAPDPPIGNLPYPSLSSLFKGRSGILEQTRDYVLGNRDDGTIVCHAFHGLAGVGKTRAAVEYAHRYKTAYHVALFVVGGSPEAIRHNFAALAGPTALNLPRKTVREQDVRFQAVLAWMNAHPGWLLVLDNVDSREAMAEAHRLLANVNGGHVIFTSRLASFASYIRPVEIEALTTRDATAFLIERTRRYRVADADDETTARGLSEDVGGLALALEQAGAYIERERLSFARYRSLWRENWSKVANWSDPAATHYPVALATTWRTAINALREPARELLACIAWVAAEPVPYFMLEVPASCIALATPTNAATFAALDDLAASSIVRCDGVGGEFRVHPLVQEITRNNLQQDAARRALAETLAWFDHAFTGDPEDIETRGRLDRLRLHARTLVSHAERAGLEQAAAALMRKLGDYLASKALYADARPLLERALAMRELHLGIKHPETATSLISLAGLYQAEGNLDDARLMAERGLAIREEVLGPEHPDVATVLNNLLGGLVRAQGDLDGALAHCRRSLVIREKAFGPDHPETARSLNDVSSVLRCQGDLAAARVLCVRALAIREQTVGEAHIDTARSLTSVGLLLQGEGDHAAARPMHERALAIRERVFGPEHPLTARSLTNLAHTLQALDCMAEAQFLHERAVDIRTKVLGSDHSDTKASRAALAELLRMREGRN